MTKFKGQVASYAPMLGLVQTGIFAIALGASLQFAGATPGFAGDCLPGSAPGDFLCSGPADPINDQTQVLTFSRPGNLLATTEPGFGLDTETSGGGDGIVLQKNDAGDLIFLDANSSDIRARGTGLSADTDANAGSISITSTGEIGGGPYAVRVNSQGSGSVDVSLNNVQTLTGTGVRVENTLNGTGLSVTTSGFVQAQNDGIYATNNGSGALSISAASVFANRDGVYARNFDQGTDLTVSSEYSVNGYERGIVAINRGSGELTLMTNEVGSELGDGIYAFNYDTGTAVTITANGSVSGGLSGIVAGNAGSQDLTILALQDVVGADTGIIAENVSGGDLSVTTAGSVTGTGNNGIYANNEDDAGNLTITATGLVTGQRDGIEANNRGTGVLSVNAGDVTGTLGDGIDADNRANGTGISVTSTGTVSGGINGIGVANYGAGSTTVSAVNVNGQNSGIVASGGQYSSDLTITATGAVTGGSSAISVYSNGTGQVAVSANSATGGLRGVIASSQQTTTGLTITATGTVTGNGAEGISASHDGTGAVTITTAVVSGDDDGIQVQNSANGSDLSVFANGSVSGGDTGINAENEGSGDVSIRTAQGVSGDNFGIVARNSNGGDLSIVTDGNVTGLSNDGIEARSEAGTRDLVINANGPVNGARDGIEAVNLGMGVLDITASDITAERRGILAFNATDGTSLTITTTGTVISNGNTGIYATNRGSEGMTIDVQGSLNASFDGINSVHYGQSALSISANNVQAGSRGIYARSDQLSTGLSIESSGQIEGQDIGIFAFHAGSGDLAIDVNDVVGDNSGGIRARNNGSAALTIAAANVGSQNEDGIYAVNLSRGTALTITTSGVVSGADAGIDARNAGNANLRITSDQDVTGGDRGIDAINRNGGDLIISANGAVTGTSSEGIFADNGSGTDNLTVTATGPVRGGADGVRVNSRGAGQVTISTADVSGATRGIYATSEGSTTSLSITTTGTVTGATQEGILGTHRGSGAASVIAENVSGATDGIQLSNTTSGTNLSANATGTVQALQEGIAVRNSGTGATEITAVDVSGMTRGVIGVNYDGSSDLTITTTGSVSSSLGEGIFTTNRGSGDTIINATGDITSELNAVDSVQVGPGSLSISIANANSNRVGVFGISEAGSTGLSIESSESIYGRDGGILSLSDGTGDVSIVANDVSSQLDGISASTFGAQDLSITVTGEVTSTTRDAITASTREGRHTQIIATSGSRVGGLSGSAIVNNEGDSDTVFQSGSVLAGAVSLGAGADSLSLQGVGVLVNQLDGFDFDGGDGTDTLSFDNVQAGLDQVDLLNWETVNVNTGSDLRFSAASDTLGADILNLSDSRISFVNGLLVVGAGGFAQTVQISRRSIIDANVTNSGNISLSNGQTSDVLAVRGNLTGTGNVTLDVGNDGNDRLDIGGNTAGANQLLFIRTTATLDGQTQAYLLVEVDGEATAGDFELGNADTVSSDGERAIVSGAHLYTLSFDQSTNQFVLSALNQNGQLQVTSDAAIYGANVQALGDLLNVGSASRRLASIAQRNLGNGDQFVTRSLHELITTDGSNLTWFEVSGGRDGYSFDGRDVDTSFGRIEFGLGIPVLETGAGVLIAGLELGATDLSTTAQAATLNAASSSTTSYDATLSGLWLGNNLFYAEGQARFATFDNTLNYTDGTAEDINGSGFAASIEVGKEIPIAGTNSQIVPQAQLIYNEVRSDDSATTGGSLTDGDTLTGRLGLRYQYFNASGNQFYSQVDWFHAFDNQTAVSFGGTELPTRRNRDRAQLTVGGQWQLSETGSLFGELSVSDGFGGTSSDELSISGQFGFAMSF
ncbi:beta strand repeat-containing protein [Ruegeria atlantica]|uniref:beta strand repeat-containing protein n=1 Tax=Ruegeria atlantica TaxID=81569 RepID=UPI00147C3181|nr:autotransporter outer membrane beta-barrel domain-containing protein [Ruegeria atlantica]